MTSRRIVSGIESVIKEASAETAQVEGLKLLSSAELRLRETFDRRDSLLHKARAEFAQFLQECREKVRSLDEKESRNTQMMEVIRALMEHMGIKDRNAKL